MSTSPLAKKSRTMSHDQIAFADRHAAIAERIVRVHSGEATTLSMEEVERTVREEHDF